MYSYCSLCLKSLPSFKICFPHILLGFLRSFILSVFIFRTVIHLKLVVCMVCIWGWCQGSFFSKCIAVFEHHLWNRLSISHWISWGTLKKLKQMTLSMIYFLALYFPFLWYSHGFLCHHHSVLITVALEVLKSCITIIQLVFFVFLPRLFWIL